MSLRRRAGTPASLRFRSHARVRVHRNREVQGETDAKGGRQRRSATVGSLADYPTESAVRKSPDLQALLLRINSEAAQPGAPPPTFGAVLARYERRKCRSVIRPARPTNPTSKFTSACVGPTRHWRPSKPWPLRIGSRISRSRLRRRLTSEASCTRFFSVPGGGRWLRKIRSSSLVFEAVPNVSERREF